MRPKSGKICPKMCHFGHNIEFYSEVLSMLRKQKIWRLCKDESPRFLSFNLKYLSVISVSKRNQMKSQARFFAHISGQFSVCKTESLFCNWRSVCLSVRIPYAPRRDLAKFSTPDPWRLTPRRHRVPIALTQTLDLSQTPPRAAPSVLTSRI